MQQNCASITQEVVLQNKGDKTGMCIQKKKAGESRTTLKQTVLKKHKGKTTNLHRV